MFSLWLPIRWTRNQTYYIPLHDAKAALVPLITKRPTPWTSSFSCHAHLSSTDTWQFHPDFLSLGLLYIWRWELRDFLDELHEKSRSNRSIESCQMWRIPRTTLSLRQVRLANIRDIINRSDWVNWELWEAESMIWSLSSSMLSLATVRLSGRACTNLTRTGFVAKSIRDHHSVWGFPLASPRASLGVRLRVDWVCCDVSQCIPKCSDQCLPRTPRMLTSESLIDMRSWKAWVSWISLHAATRRPSMLTARYTLQLGEMVECWTYVEKSPPPNVLH